MKTLPAKNEYWEVAPGVTCIELTQGKYALIDTADLRKVAGYKWFAHREGIRWYAKTNARVPDGLKITLGMHPLLLDTPKGFETDHLDGNSLDNRRANLRVVTARQNQQNQHRPKTSRFPGVCWLKRKAKWQAQIQVAEKNIYLGAFKEESVAATAYRIACDVAYVRLGDFLGSLPAVES